MTWREKREMREIKAEKKAERLRISGRKTDRIVNLLKKEGAAKVKVIPAGEIVIDERVRFKCQVPLCDSYGRNLLCPPNLPSVAQFRLIVAGYEKAVLVQVISALKPSDDPFAPARKLHEIINAGEREAFLSGFPFAAGLIGGCCRLCRTCVAARSGRACRHPFQARPSMEAMGIDVLSTAANAGLPVIFPAEGSVTWTGLILL